jgi:UDP:flavonoid glycosyltransferase YjiC (YdhE family)
LEEFLNAGAPPIIFAFGSSSRFAVEILHPVSIAAAVRLGVRAVVLTGSSDATMPGSGTNNDRVFVGGFAPYSALFPRARAVIHHGGIGTIARALRAGKPMLITPFYTDQPANAVLAQRWGVARLLPPENYSIEPLVDEIHQVIGNPGYTQRARQFSKVLLKEDGAVTASDVIERLASATDDGLLGPASRNPRRH